MRGSALFASVLLAPAAVTAGEACISCTGPAATYRCGVEGSDKLDKIAGGDKALAQVCAKVLAKIGPHEKCEPGGAQPKSCEGAKAKVLTLADFQQALAGGDGYVPDTKVEGVLPGAQRVATDSLQSAGDTISSTARKSWDCVASLFGNC